MASSNKVLTIDITNESITIIEATASQKKQTNIHNAIIFETPSESYEDGQIKNKEKIAAAIKEQLASHGISNKNVIFVLNSTKVVNREVMIPFVKENKIKGIINANAAEYFPVNIEDYVVAHTVLETVTGENKTKQLRVMVVAAPIGMVKSYYDVAAQVGLNVVAIDYIGNAMLQLIKTQTSANSTTMVIQLGSESTVLNIVKGDTLLLQRTIPYGTNGVVSEVMDQRGVDATTAMTLLQNERLITVDFDENTITGAFRYLMNNIGRVMDYYASKNPDKPIDDVYLTGDGALIRGIDGLFKIQLNVTTRVMDSLYNVKFDQKIDLKIYNPVYLIVPIGAALAPMNFSAASLGKTQKSGGGSIAPYAAFLILSIIVSVGGIGAVFLMKMNANAKKNELTVKINNIKEIEDIINQYEAAKAQAEDIENLRLQTEYNNERLINVIEALEEKSPVNVTITSLVSTQDGITFNCQATDKTTIAKYIQQLYTVEDIDQIIIPSIATDEDDTTGSKVYTYTINCIYSIDEVVVEEPADGSVSTDTTVTE